MGNNNTNPIAREVIKMTEHKDIVLLAIYAGEILLRNGAETYRVEDTINRICYYRGVDFAETFVTPTGLIVSVDNKESHPVTIIRKITRRETNLTKVSAVNAFSRRFVSGKISIDEGMAELKAIDRQDLGYSHVRVFLSGGVAAGAAAVLLGGSWDDFFPALLVAFVIRIVLSTITLFRFSLFLDAYVAGFTAAITGFLLIKLGWGQHLSEIITGALVPLFPGVALTNSIRDFITGDLQSGTVRGVEALLAAGALAGGVGIGLSIFVTFLEKVI
ncbi:MAG: threonine/serine exporter family protein [Clostridia bacterium]|nr:threonine/serine exporter family protein [Clostridia bacterium]